jgi:hypothetical protein
MNISLLAFFAYVCLGGAIGGLVGEIAENSLFSPRRNPDGSLDLGFLRNVLCGAVAGAISQIEAFKKSDATSLATLLPTCLSAALVGIGGSNWVKSKLDAKTNQAAAASLAGQAANPDKATRILAAKSAHEVLQIAREQ